ncbi:acyl-CoA thioesterase [Acinetobacter pragensis]|uniref:Acyl-CoA thioesterase n=1 Tax=Acinetobacter pragensis TaxID=1806892 RepID=A0A151Y5A8_9GAMM|nr:acyl-CoA thioesterase [Acinetobacter pragensis]KYQ73218.1 acyl-CoA thioesterase [Acinetobacter pragensis]
MKRSRKLAVPPKISWTTEQDIYLIENSTLDISQLCIQLAFTEEQIIERKEVLGLIRRERQMRRFRGK